MSQEHRVSTGSGTLPKPSDLHFVTPASSSIAEDGSLIVKGFGYCYRPAVTARLLAAHQGDVEISGLWEVSPEVAAALSRHSGLLKLFTTKRIPLSEASAEALGQHQGELVLCSCRNLSDRAWSGIARHRGDIRLVGPAHLSARGAQSLAGHHGFLDLPYVRKLSPAAAEALSKHKGGISIGLSCRETTVSHRRSAAIQSFLTDSQFKVLSLLAQAEGALYLDDINRLEANEVEALSAAQGHLSLQGLEWNSAVLAGALANHRGHLSLSASHYLSWASAKALSKHRGGLTLFCTFGQPPQHLEALVQAASGGIFSLSGFKNISAQDARWVASHAGPVELLYGSNLSQTAARALARHRHELSLNVDHLSPQAATELLAHPGPLTLDIDGPLSDATAHILSHFPGKLICAPQVMQKINKFKTMWVGQKVPLATSYSTPPPKCEGDCLCTRRRSMVCRKFT